MLQSCKVYRFVSQLHVPVLLLQELRDPAKLLKYLWPIHILLFDCATCEILLPSTRDRTCALWSRSAGVNDWTTREVLSMHILNYTYITPKLSFCFCTLDMCKKSSDFVIIILVAIETKYHNNLFFIMSPF